jgi:polyphosphate glucokinase
MTSRAVGIDIGGTGIKGALVDVSSGELRSERVKYDTPPHATPDDVVAVINQILSDIGPEQDTLPMGVCFPAVVRRGVTTTATNVSETWIDFPAEKYLEEKLGRQIAFLNDADAAGVAEAHYGAAKDVPGLVIVTTLGTGIGGAMLFDGILIPNFEVGHLELDGVVVETTTSRAAARSADLSFEQWAKLLERFYRHLSRVFSPDLIVVGGGVSKQADQFLPLIDCPTPLVEASLKNNAGIMGAAYLAASHTG